MIRASRAVVPLVALLATAATGCFWVTTKAEGKALQKDVTHLKSTVGTQQGKIDAKMVELQKVLDSATELLARNTANIGDDVKGLENDLRHMRGLLNEVKSYTDELKSKNAALTARLEERQKYIDNKLADMDQRLMILENKTAGPQTPEELYRAGKAAMAKKDYETARRYFKNLVLRHSMHSLADDAQYLRGETYMREKHYDAAIAEFQKIFDKYPTGDMADDAFYRAGQAAEALKSCTEARAYYGALRSKYPRSSLAKKAHSCDRYLAKHARNKKVCKK